MLCLDEDFPQAVQEGRDPEEPLKNGGEHDQPHDGGEDDLQGLVSFQYSPSTASGVLLTSCTGHSAVISSPAIFHAAALFVLANTDRVGKKDVERMAV